MKHKLVIAIISFTIGLLIMHMFLLYTPLSDGMSRYDLQKPMPPTKDIIPDGETAKRIADAFFDVYYVNSTAYKENRFAEQDKMDINLHVTFNKYENTWSVYYLPILSEGSDDSNANGLPEITMRKDNGKIVSIGLSE